MADGRQQSDSSGARQKNQLTEEEDVEYTPGGSDEPNPDPEHPGGTAASHHPPAEG